MKQRNIEPYPAWADAHLAHKYIYKGKARGSTVALFVRGVTQRRLGHVGKWAGRRGGILIFLGIASMAMLCIGINNVRLDTTLDSLWTPNSGRLLQELTYVSKVSGLTTDTNEMLIQTPKKDAHSSILHSKALLEHLQVLQKALAVTVDLYDITWSLTDLCYSANIPNFDVQMIDQIFEKIFPCVIITPLDCFWEGAKLLGPSFPIQIPNLANFRGPPLKWTNLNPQELLARARLVGLAHSGGGGVGFPFEILEGFMKRAGIGSGYQEKPCLDPQDPECPAQAPNKGSHMPPDVASILAQGCYGFAPRFMHWAPDLIIGGTVQNKSGHVVKAGGLMSTVQLMSSSELFEFFRETWRLHHVEWTESKAQAVLTAWQTRFAAEVSHLTMDEERSHQFNFYSFTPAGLDSVVESASQFSWAWGGARVIGVIIAASFVGIVLSGDMANWRVRLGLVVGGALIALLGSAAGCGAAAGLSMITAITFNVASVQVMPYLTMSLVSQVFFILLHSQLNSGCDARSTLKRHGFSLLLGIIVAAVFIGAGAIFPIPAVRSIALQGAMLIIVSSFGLLIVFPALCQTVLKKRKVSTACTNVANNTGCAPGACAQAVPFLSSNNNRSSNRSANKFGPAVSVKNNNVNLNKSNNTNSVNYSNKNSNDGRDSVVFICDDKGKNTKAGGDVETGDCDEGHEEVSKNWIEYYNCIIDWKWCKGVVGVVYLAWIIVSGLGMIRLRLGLPITDVVPSNSSEYQFLTAQGKLFPVYHMRAVTKANFDYPNNQKLLHRFHDTMSGLPWVIRDDNGGVPPMWLSVFRSWLVRLQAEFDREWKEGKLHKEGWNDNASADGILAWKLAVQTGHVDHPVDITQLPGNRLVDGEGVVNARAFYVYLTAWAWNDPLAYGSTAANLKPEPRNWVHSPEDKDLKIPKSAPIKYAEISYLLRTVRDDQTEQDQESQILAFVREIRQICGMFEGRGLPVFPWGIPFRFYEQYLDLPMKSGIVVGSAAAVTSVILFFSLGCSLRPVGVVFTIALVTLIQIAGTVGWLGVGLNALPVEIALLGVSLVVVATIQMLVAFCCIPGPVSVRRAVSFNLVGPPCVQSLVLITLTALILYSPEFMFIFTHFTLLVALSAVFSLANFLFLLPSLLSILKPTCWLVGLSPEDPALLQPLTPSPLPKRSGSSKTQRSSGSRSGSKSSRNSYPPPPYSFRGSSSRGGNYYHGGSSRNGANSRAPSENSLSTITEEPSSCATRRSAEIIVQPQVVVETFDGDTASKTKVSAKLKVEVHSSMHSSNSNTHSVVTSSNMSENSGTSASTSSSGSFTSSSASSSTSSYNEKVTDD